MEKENKASQTEQTLPTEAAAPTHNANMLLIIISIVIFTLLGAIIIYLLYQNNQLQQQLAYMDTMPQQNLSTKKPAASAITPPISNDGEFHPITQDDDWGYITVKELNNELNAMTPARFKTSFPTQPTPFSKYSEPNDSCLTPKYQPTNNKNYTLHLLLPHVGLRYFTQQHEEQIVINGKQFTKSSHFTDGTLTAIYYKSDILSQNAEGTMLQFTWDAYLTTNTDIEIDNQIISATEKVLGQTEIVEINTSGSTLCEIKQQSK